jgi:KaiC/GvpD/RAD55 family RecA-like ATPase
VIPEELRVRKQWVLWKYVNRDGKPTKVPFQIDGKPASSVDPATWNTFDACRNSSERYAGLGYVFSVDDPYIGIDLDGCRVNGKLEDWAKEIVMLMGSYAEVSPSETGVKIFGRIDAPIAGANHKLPNMPKVCEEKEPGVELYCQGRYFAVTGKRLAGMAEIKDVSAKMAWMFGKLQIDQPQAIQKYADITIETPVLERAKRYVQSCSPSISGQGGHNAAFKVACHLVKGFCLSQDEAFHVFSQVYNPLCVPAWSEREIRHKLAQAKKQPGADGYLRDAMPENWTKVQMPTQWKEDRSEKEEPRTIRTLSLRQAANDFLDQAEAGKKRLIETGVPKLDDAIGGGVDDGEMIVVAARPSQGKSALALQMSHTMTRNGLPVCFVSEEMSSMALGKRAVQFITEEEESDWQRNAALVRKDIEKHFEKRADSIIIESCGHVDKACEMIEELHRTIGVRCAFVDYAQILGGKGKDKYQAVSYVSSTLKRLSTRLNIAVVVLAQLGREIGKNKDFTPTMRDLKDSGQIEQDADVIVAGVYPCRFDEEIDPAEYTIHVLKNRNREIRSFRVDLFFNTQRQRFFGADWRMTDHGNYVSNGVFNREY